MQLSWLCPPLLTLFIANINTTLSEAYPAAISTGRKLSKDAANVGAGLYTVKVFKPARGLEGKK